MEYLTRPVFEFPIDWQHTPGGPWKFDLNELQVGFGAEIFSITQSHVAHGYNFECHLINETEIDAFDTFFEALTGRLQGFWFPSPVIAFNILDGVDANEFDIENQDYASTFADHPSQYIYFSKAGETSLIAKVTAVAAAGDDERVTIDANHSIDATWQAYRLIYVRLVDDVERGTFEAEGKMNRTVKLVELPLEYADAESGTKPFYLYHFQLMLGTSVLHNWYWTSHYQNVTSNGQVYTAKPITHGALKQGLRLTSSEFNFESVWEADSPLALFYPVNLTAPLWLKVSEGFVPAPDAVTQLFFGRVLEAPRKGKKISASAVSVLAMLGRKIAGHPVGPKCPYMVFDEHTCKADLPSKQFNGSISTLGTTNIIRVTAADLNGKPDNYLAGGWIETGAGQNKEVRHVLQSSEISATVHEVVLNAHLKFAILNQAVICTPGCPGTESACTTLYANYGNFGGFRYVPKRNPTLKGMDIESTSGGKK
jgi:hypothetical protein